MENALLFLEMSYSDVVSDTFMDMRFLIYAIKALT